MKNKYWPIISAIIMAAIIFLIHMALAYFLQADDVLALLPVLYAALVSASVIILVVLVLIKNRNIDSVGNAFMLLTCVKMVIIYLAFKTFAAELGTDGLPKGHLIAAFFTMLLAETYCTSRMLNKNRP